MRIPHLFMLVIGVIFHMANGEKVFLVSEMRDCEVEGTSFLYWLSPIYTSFWMGFYSGPIKERSTNGWLALQFRFNKSQEFTILSSKEYVIGIGVISGNLSASEAEWTKSADYRSLIKLLDVGTAPRIFSLWKGVIVFDMQHFAPLMNYTMDVNIIYNDNQQIEANHTVMLDPPDRIDHFEISFARKPVMNCKSLPPAIHRINRYEMIVSLGFMSLNVLIGSILLCIVAGTIVTCRWQPMQSRFIVPHIYSISLLSHLIFATVSYWKTTEFQFLLLTISYILFLFAQIIFLIYCIRYLAIRNLYRIMSHSTNGTLLVIYKKLVGRIPLVIAIISTSAIFTIVLLVVSVVSLVENSARTPFTNRVNIAILAFGASLLAMAFAWFVFDLGLNLLEIVKKGVRWYFFFDDPHCFRLDLLVMTTAGTLHILFFVFWRVAERFRTYETAYQAHAWAIVLICYLTFIYFLYLLAGSGGVVAIVTLYYRIFSKQRKHSDEQSEMILVLTDDSGFKLFSDYCQKELSLENIMLWKELYRWKEMQFISLSDATDLYLDYVQFGGIYQVNIPSSSVSRYSEILEQKSKDGEDELSFDEIAFLYNDIIANLCDTYSRLLNLSYFQNYSRIKKTQRELLTDNYELLTPLFTTGARQQ